MRLMKKRIKRELPKKILTIGGSKGISPSIKESIDSMVKEEMNKNGYKRSEDPMVKEVDKLFRTYTGKGLDI